MSTHPSFPANPQRRERLVNLADFRRAAAEAAQSQDEAPHRISRSWLAGDPVPPQSDSNPLQ